MSRAAAWRFATSSSRARAVESSPVAGPRPQGLSDLLGNPFEPAVIDRVDVDIRVEYRNDVAEIISASLPDERVRPARPCPCAWCCALRGQGIRRGRAGAGSAPLAGKTIKIDVASGALVRPDVPKPRACAA